MNAGLPPVPPTPPPGYSTTYPYGGPPPVEKVPGLAIASMVLGILSIFVWWGAGIILGTLAIIFFVKTPRRANGARFGMATAGLVTGILGVVFSSFWMLIIISLVSNGSN